MDETYDHIVVGSGINGLVCAAMLALRGRRVLLLERSDRLGGCLLTDDVTAPGFTHDVMATTFVLFVTSAAYAELGPALARHGVAFCDSAVPTGVLLTDGRHAVLTRDAAANAAAFDRISPGDGAAFAAATQSVARNAPLLFALLGGRLWSAAMARLALREVRRRGLRGMAAFLGESLITGRAFLESTYRSDLVRALFAPWVLHCGLTPESAFSGQMLKVIGFALEAAGAPIVQGGAQALVAAFRQVILEHGGAVRTGADVARVNVTAGRADGVTLADGERLRARHGVIASSSPQQLYLRLLGGEDLPPAVREGLAQYRFGRGNMQIHYALRQPAPWTAAVHDVALLHLADGLDGVSRSCNEAERGLLPAAPTICVGQPTVLDPTRAPAGQAVLWIQLPDCPRLLRGDAGAEIAVPADGAWTAEVREAFADRVEAMIERHAPGFRAGIIARRAYSPADLEKLNVNLVGGDPYGGFCGIDQFLLWRPFKTSVNHTTHVRGLYHIGASTHPGPGLSGGSGYLLARSLTRRFFPAGP